MLDQPKITPSSDADWKNYYYKQMKTRDQELREIVDLVHGDGGTLTAKMGMHQSLLEAKRKLASAPGSASS